MEQDLDYITDMFQNNQQGLDSPDPVPSLSLAPTQESAPSMPEPTAITSPDQAVPTTPVVEAPKFKSTTAQIIDQNRNLFEEAGISGHRLTHFMAQMAHESGGFRYMEEIDPSLSNLGNKGGEAYKGRGIIQLTGIDNYRYYGQKLGIDLENNPQLAADPTNSVKIAIEFWKQNKLNEYADRGDIRGITRIINGPKYTQKSLASRQDWLARAGSVQTDDPAALAEALTSQIGASVKLPKTKATMFDSDREEERALSSASKVYRKPDDSWFPSISNTFERTKLTYASDIREVTRKNTSTAIKEIEKLTGVKAPEQSIIPSFSDVFNNIIGNTEATEQESEKQRFNDYLAAVKAQAPDIALPYKSYADIETAAASEIVSRKEMADEQVEQLYKEGNWVSDVGTFVGQLVGGMGGFLSDPGNAGLALATAPIGGGAGLGSQIAANVAVNVGQEVVGDVRARELESSIGIERTAEETVQNLVAAAAVGTAIPVIGRGLKSAYQSYKGTPAGDMAAKAINDIVEDTTGISPDMSPFGDSPTGNVKLDAIISRELVESTKTGLPPVPVPDNVQGVDTPDIPVKLAEHDDILRSLAETPEEKQMIEEIISQRQQAVAEAPKVSPSEYEAQLKSVPEESKKEFKQVLDSQHKDVSNARLAVQTYEQANILNSQDLKAKDVYLKDLRTQLDTIASEANETNLRYNSFTDKSSADAELAKEQLRLLGERYGQVVGDIESVSSATSYLNDSITSVRETIEPLRKDLEVHSTLIQDSEARINLIDQELAKEVDTNSIRYQALQEEQVELRAGLNASKKIYAETEKTLSRQEKRLGGLEKRLETLEETSQAELARFEKALSKSEESAFKAEIAQRKERLQSIIAEHERSLEQATKDGDTTTVRWEDAEGIEREGTVLEYRQEIEGEKRALDSIVGCAAGIGA